MKKREFRRILKKKGFIEVVAKDHIYLYLRDPNDPEKYYSHVRTKISHSGKEKDISDNLLAKMYRQLGSGVKRTLWSIWIAREHTKIMLKSLGKI